jgi:hypothetical protein
MGLLDSLFAQSSYGGQGGGLLDFLRQSQMQQEQYQPSAGFPGQASPMNVGGYQMPRVGDQAQFTPPPQDPAALPPNAQPAQGQLPQAPQQAPAFGPQGEGNFTAGMRAFGNPGGLINKVADAVQGFSTGQTPATRNQSELFKAYVGAGLSPQQAMIAVLNPPLAPNLMGGGQTDDIKEYQFAKKEDPTLTFDKFMNRKKATSGEYGMQPIWGTGPDGKPAVLQLGKSGDAKQSVLPPGFNLARDPIKVEGPTGTTILDPQTRQQVGFIPKDNAKKEADEKIGQARGTAQAALNNGADIDAQATIKKIDEFVSSKGFNEVFGQLDQYRPSWTHSNEGADALARYKQLKGTAFLSAYSMLKGGGAITDIEGQKAGDAMARLDRAQGEEEAKAALRDFREAVDVGLQKLKRAANGGAEPAAPAATPKRIRLNADGTIAQ